MAVKGLNQQGFKEKHLLFQVMEIPALVDTELDVLTYYIQSRPEQGLNTMSLDISMKVWYIQFCKIIMIVHSMWLARKTF